MSSVAESCAENLAAPEKGSSDTARLNIELREARTAGESPAPRALADALSQATGISSIAARVLVSRGITTAEAAASFLAPNFRNQLPDPGNIKNMPAAVELILDFVESGEAITIYTDFDVDGVSAGSQLFLYLQCLGANVTSYTPSRFAEGYGLVCSAVERLAERGTKLLVTVDCGISSHRELELAKKLGMRSIVLDHHLPSGIPPADVVVDPAQDGCPFQEHKLAAAGLVWMLLIVLRKRAKERFREQCDSGKLAPPDPKDFLDLAALGTICDMVPLIGLNRVIAYRGVEALRATQRPGLVALKQVAGVDNNPRFGSGHVAFGLGPRINAAGRLADATDVIQMLTTEDSVRAKSIAASIDRLNDQRRQVEESVKTACLSCLAAEPALLERPALALYGESYHIGVIGIVAQRMVEQYHRPAAVMAPGEMIGPGGAKRAVIKGSVRSVRGFHVADALYALRDLLVTHGGHAEAGGFSLEFEKREAFCAAFVEQAEKVLGAGPLARRLVADLEVDFSEVDFDLVNELSRFAPFGVGNPAPLLITHGVDVVSASSVGSNHLKARFMQGKYALVGIGWGLATHPLLRKGKRVSLAYQPELNTYQGVSSVQLNIREVWTDDRR